MSSSINNLDLSSGAPVTLPGAVTFEQDITGTGASLSGAVSAESGTFGSVSITNNATVGGALSVTGALNLDGQATLSGGASISGSLQGSTAEFTGALTWAVPFGGTISANYTFQSGDNGKIFYINADGLTLTVPTGLLDGWNVAITCGGTYPTTLITQQGGFLGLSGVPSTITLGAVGPSNIAFFNNSADMQIIAASPDIWQAYNAVSGDGGEIVTPLTIVGDPNGVVADGNNIVFDGALTGNTPNISVSGVDSNISLSLNPKGTGIVILENGANVNGVISGGAVSVSGGGSFVGSVDLATGLSSTSGNGLSVGPTISSANAALLVNAPASYPYDLMVLGINGTTMGLLDVNGNLKIAGALTANGVTLGSTSNVSGLPAEVTSTTGTELTAAQMYNGAILRSGPTAAFTDTTDTAANIMSSIGPNAPVGSSYTLSITNLTAYTMTLEGGTGVTISGVATIAPKNAIIYRVTVTDISTPTVTITRIMSGGT